MSVTLTDIEQNLIEGNHKIKANNRYSSKLSYKRMQDLELAKQADEYLREKNIYIPQYEREFRNNEENYLVDVETGEILIDEHINLVRMIYDFRRHNKAVYALFPNPENPKKQRSQLLAAWYSRHRCSYVWNWKKSKLIRSLWKNYLTETNIHEKYQAMHLVLTVPHKDGIWNGKKFYASDILAHFNQMRKSEQWKDCIFGGEYGVEVKKSKEGNGLHIHLHCLVFQQKHIPVNYVRQFIQEDWEILTGAKFIHYETLYVHKKDESGEYHMVSIPAHEYWSDTEEFVINDEKLVRKKFYLDDTQEWYAKLTPEEKLKEYVNGVMECIKYHFKADWCERIDGNYDIELINEVLNHSKGLRFYSKFGGFYKDHRLNYDYLANATDEEIAKVESSEYDVDFTSAEHVEERLTNPYTYLPATATEYDRFISIPEKKIHKPNADIEHPNMPLVMNQKLYYKIRKDVTINKIIKSLAKSTYQEILEPDEYQRFCLEHMPVSNHRNTRTLLNNLYEQEAIRSFEWKKIFGDNTAVPF